MKGFIHIFMLIILLIGAALGGYLVQQKTSFLSKAFFVPVALKDNVITNPSPSITAIPKNTTTSKSLSSSIPEKPFVSVFDRLMSRNIPTPTTTPTNPTPGSSTLTFTPTPEPTTEPTPTPIESGPTSTPTPTPTLIPTPTVSIEPIITNVNPLEAMSGGVISILGANLRPTDVSESTLRVYLKHSNGTTILLGYVSPPNSNISWDDDSIALILPTLSAQSGNIMVTVGADSVVYPETFTVSEVSMF